MKRSSELSDSPCVYLGWFRGKLHRPAPRRTGFQSQLNYLVALSPECSKLQFLCLDKLSARRSPRDWVVKAPLGLDLPQQLSSSYCDDYEGMEGESGWLLSLLGENVEGSFNSSPLLAQWRRVHITENPMVSVFNHIHTSVCSAWG